MDKILSSSLTMILLFIVLMLIPSAKIWMMKKKWEKRAFEALHLYKECAKENNYPYKVIE